MTTDINGTYGSNKTPSTIFIYDNLDGTAWYAIEGSMNVNLCNREDLVEGVDVELINDYDCFTYGKNINTILELVEAVEV